MRYLSFLPGLAVGVGVATTVAIYVIFAVVFGSSEDYHLSSVLSRGCDAEPILRLAYSLAVFGYGTMLLLLLGVAFFRAFEDAKTHPRSYAWAAAAGVLGGAAFFVMVSFPSGGFDNVHRAAAGAAVFLLTVYGLLTWRRGRWFRNLVIAFLALEAVGMMVTWLLARGGVGGSFRWNLFAVFQLQFAVAWFAFVLLMRSRSDFVPLVVPGGSRSPFSRHRASANI